MAALPEQFAIVPPHGSDAKSNFKTSTAAQICAGLHICELLHAWPLCSFAPTSCAAGPRLARCQPRLTDGDWSTRTRGAFTFTRRYFQMVATHYPSVQLGYSLSCEEHRPADLVRFARRAEEVGFTHAMISDHFHPWIDRQGNSPFVWSVLGGIAEATQRLHVATSVTCPILRYHPALIAHSAATIASMMPGRFMLGVGTGEN